MRLFVTYFPGKLEKIEYRTQETEYRIAGKQKRTEVFVGWALAHRSIMVGQAPPYDFLVVIGRS